MKNIFLSFLLSTFRLGIFAQQFAMTPLPNQQKLPQSEIYRIFEDSEGYMWYATQGAGLCRDNGYQVDVFRSDRHHPTLLRSNVVTCISENVTQHQIWFGTKQGAYVLNKNDYSIKTLESVKSHVRDIKQSSDGCMWVAAGKQMKVFSPKGELQDSFALSWKGEAMGVETMTIDSQGTLWIMQWNGGIQTIDTHSRQLSTMNWESAVGPTSLAEDSLHHRFYVGTWGDGIYRYDGRQAERLNIGLITPMQQKVRSLHYDKWRNMVWAVTMAGLYAYTVEPDGSLTPHPMTCLGLTPQQAIYQLTFDHSGNLWVPGTTPLSFILRPTHGKWMERTSLDELTRQAGVRVPIGAFQTDHNYCWMWSDRTQLVLYDKTTCRLASVNGIPDEGTTRFGNILTKRKKGGVWCATGTRVYACDHDGMKVQLQQQPTVVAANTISALCEDDEGNLYIGTSNDLCCYHPATNTLTTIASNTRTVRDIVVTPDGRVFFICVGEGICVTNKGQGDKDYKVIAPYQRFTSLAYGNDGRLWVGNAFGDVWQVDSVMHYVPVASNAQGNGVKQLLCDSLNHLWVMGDIYLAEYHPDSDLRRLFLSSDRNLSIDNFCSMSLTEDGAVMVAGSGGLLKFVPKDIVDSVPAYHPIVAAYVANGEKQLLSSVCKHIDISPSIVTLELELTSFNFLKADNQQFAYRLRGLSDQWIELPMGKNTVQFVNLRKGTYVLELKVCDSYARWSGPVEVLTIERQPAWYETWFAYLCYLLILAFIAVWGIRFYLKRHRKQAQRQMDERLNRMKLRFFTNVSHELRTPLSLIITPLESIIQKVDPSSIYHTQLKGVLKHANELLDLVNRLLDFRKLSMGEMKLHPSSGDLFDFLRTCVATFQPMTDKKGLELQLQMPEGAFYTEFDSNAMRHVMYNLLSNAMKYTDKGHVCITVGTSPALTIAVSDTGMGIKSDELSHIFDRYYQASNADDRTIAGSGIGLNMVKELIEQMGGTITAESELGKGSTFTVTLPIAQIANEEDELPSAPVIPKLPSLLIADDNDDFRDFLVQELTGDYNILQARNGVEALRLAQTHYVDVILSDVMMPQMDGNELCRQLRSNEATSHIFIMLLTAKTAEKSVLEGYEAGADFYLTKPFSIELLRNRLQHLAKMQEQRIQMLAKNESSEEPLSEEEMRISPIDRKFMTKMKSVMERFVADTTFSVDVFCSEMSMSRMNFYRKMHALTGLTPAQYINDYRLTLADRLLREGELNVSEVADRTGFTTASYFSKCYKTKFGVAPKEVRIK